MTSGAHTQGAVPTRDLEDVSCIFCPKGWEWRPGAFPRQHQSLGSRKQRIGANINKHAWSGTAPMCLPSDVTHIARNVTRYLPDIFIVQVIKNWRGGKGWHALHMLQDPYTYVPEVCTCNIDNRVMCLTNHILGKNWTWFPDSCTTSFLLVIKLVCCYRKPC